jgi:trehalose-phosphatase
MIDRARKAHADPGEVRVVSGTRAGDAKRLPSALDCIDEILLGDPRKPVIFLDYDGTLTPIVDHPDAARLNDASRVALLRLSGLCGLAIISGRDLADVRKRVAIEGIWYAGSHGLDILGPGGEPTQHQEGTGHLRALDAAEHWLRERLAAVGGCLVERKRFCIAMHHRQVGDADVPAVKQAAEKMRAAYPTLRLTMGNKIVELRPDIGWDKGKALRWLIKHHDGDPGCVLPIYIGDDLTDEDAFREVERDGVGILVSPADQPTRAAYRLADPEAVGCLLERMGDTIEESLPGRM